MTRSRNTRQKAIIHHQIEAMTSLFTAEALFEKVHQTDPSIGVATVYRYLKDLRKQRALHSYVCDRRLIYSLQDNNHCHFICQRCDSVQHFDIDKVDFLKGSIRGDICHFQIDVHGICERCLRDAAKTVAEGASEGIPKGLKSI